MMACKTQIFTGLMKTVLISRGVFTGLLYLAP